MSTIEETIAARKKAAIPARLVKGAGILGRLWQENVRCLGEWGSLCPCAKPTDFCDAKRRWLELVRELHDGKYPSDLSGNEGFLVLECMTIEMFEASGLTIVKTAPGERALIRIGRKGTNLQTILDLEKIYTEDPEHYEEALEAVIKIQRIF